MPPYADVQVTTVCTYVQNKRSLRGSMESMPLMFVEMCGPEKGLLVVASITHLFL